MFGEWDVDPAALVDHRAGPSGDAEDEGELQGGVGEVGDGSGAWPEERGEEPGPVPGDELIYGRVCDAAGECGAAQAEVVVEPVWEREPVEEAPPDAMCCERGGRAPTGSEMPGGRGDL